MSLPPPDNLAGRHSRGFRTLSESAHQVARRLIAGGQTQSTPGAPSARAAADACGHLYRELSRWVGRDGCHALFARALGEARKDQPALEQIRLQAGSDPYVDGVAESVQASGEAATEAAIESMLAVLVDLLRRLIGNDMAAKLIERSMPSIDGTGAITDRRQEEA